MIMALKIVIVLVIELLNLCEIFATVLLGESGSKNILRRNSIYGMG